MFSQVLGGDGQVLFVRGESGAGKTSLVTEFAARSRSGLEDLVVAVGRCDPQSGRGDAFLPFREVLQTLTGDVAGGSPHQDPAGEEAHPHRVRSLSRDTVAALGPSLVGLFIPGGALLANVGLMMARKKSEAGGRRMDEVATVPVIDAAVDQDQILEQYVQVLRRLGQQLPLLVVLDDLQWADTASLALLARIGRRLEGTRILVIGTYRTSDVTLGAGEAQHPLEPVAHELTRQFGDITIDLDTDEDGRAFVDAFLDQEPNELGEEFRRTLHARTGGHPLFTVELVHHLQDHGSIVWRDGRGWAALDDLDWDQLPARVEGVIGQRLARLPEHLHRSLTIAAVEGEAFTAEVVARVQQVELRNLVRDLSETLTRRHHLVTAVGIDRVGARRLSRYRFSHVTVQHYLLRHLDEVEAGFLHEDVGLAVEELYGPDNPRTLDPLARHFHLAGVPDKARQYAERAGDRAAAAFANAAAVRHYTRALEWAEEDSDRIRLLTARVAVHNLASDLAAADEDIRALEELVSSGQDRAARASVLLLRAKHGDHTGDYAQAATDARAAATTYQEIGDPAGEGRARTVLGEVLSAPQEYAAARQELGRGLELARETGQSALEATALAGLGIVADLTGDRATGRRCFEESLAIQQRDNRTSGVVTDLIHLGVNSWRSNDLVDATERLQEALGVAQRIGARRLAGRAQANLGLLLCARLDLDAGRGHLEEALQLNREVGGPYAVARTLGLLGHAYRGLADYPRSEALEKEALEIDRQVGDPSGRGLPAGEPGRARPGHGARTGGAGAVRPGAAPRAGHRGPGRGGPGPHRSGVPASGPGGAGGGVGLRPPCPCAVHGAGGPPRGRRGPAPDGAGAACPGRPGRGARRLRGRARDRRGHPASGCPGRVGRGGATPGAPGRGPRARGAGRLPGAGARPARGGRRAAALRRRRSGPGCTG
ncbi:tetratricopeptide repeat protein [Ornithinimicrobium sp. F0845]|uniref:ATP-binding protein n=1 Tax=Ornithinimicrobium sp. F0845 TaxID=2926412 RepID=UPI001FF48434|nr:tetratricopeptide repeat protein [Ornithinimicrobium sp. F0845]